MNKIQKKLVSGFTLLELLIVIAIMAVISTIIVSSFLSFKDNQALSKDTELVVSILRQARNQTLNSKDSSVYGVRFATTTVTLFVGGTYSAATSTNQTYKLTSSDNILTINLAGGGSNIIFQRLTGETSQNGTVIISSPKLTSTKTVTIYRTGLVESN